MTTNREAGISLLEAPITMMLRREDRVEPLTDTRTAVSDILARLVFVCVAAFSNNTGRAYAAKFSDVQRGPQQRKLIMAATTVKSSQTLAGGLPELCHAKRRFLGHDFR